MRRVAGEWDPIRPRFSIARDRMQRFALFPHPIIRGQPKGSENADLTPAVTSSHVLLSGHG